MGYIHLTEFDICRFDVSSVVMLEGILRVDMSLLWNNMAVDERPDYTVNISVIFTSQRPDHPLVKLSLPDRMDMTKGARELLSKEAEKIAEDLIYKYLRNKMDALYRGP